MVFYRKYRPQTIGELDSPKLRETLIAVLSQKEIPHAFLFTGPKGLGKTSTARIIAKVLNCEHPGRKKTVIPAKAGIHKDKTLDPRTLSGMTFSIEPDNTCSQCTSITNGTNIDVLEIDGASNRGIDEIRELRERVNLAPSAANKKVYIIDEVHMLTTEAFNALLKTIEEPPSHVVFIFATTEPQKVPSTIISRCFHISLDRATEEELIHSLKRIVTEEKITIDEEVLNMIASMGDGGYRDTTKILEELVALSNGKKITKELFEEKTNVSGIGQYVVHVLEQLQEKDAKGTLEVIQKLVQQGTDVKYFLSQLLTTLHVLLLSSAGVQLATNYQLPTTPLTSEEINELVSLFSKAYQDTKYAVIPSLPLELAVVQYCQQSSVISSDSPVILSDSEGSQSNSHPELVSGSPGSSGPKSGMTMQDTRTKEQNLKVKQVLSNEPKDPKGTKETKGEVDSSQENLTKLRDTNSQLLENLIYKVKPYNHSVAGVLRGCAIGAMDGTTITFTTKYVFHKEKLEEQKVREILEKVVREVTGKQLVVVIELKK